MSYEGAFRQGGIPQSEAAKAAKARWDELKSARSRDEADWEEIARLIRPQRGGFGLSDPQSRTAEKPLSSVAIMAAGNLASGLYGTLISPATKWFDVETGDEALDRWHPMALWRDRVRSLILASFRPSVSPFYQAGIQLFSDIVAFGNAAQYDEMVPAERKIMDVTLSLADLVVDIDYFGRVNEVVRRFKLKPRAAVRQFKGALPAKVAEMAEKGTDEAVWFYQHVMPNDEFVPGKLGIRGKKHLSLTSCELEDTLISKRGYDEMPFDYPRWEVEAGAINGTGSGFIALASARLIHRMDDATIRAAQFAADPTRLVPDRDTWPLTGTVRPGSVIHGGVNTQGNAMMRTLEQHGSIGITIEEKRRLIEEIKDAFNYSLMNLAGRTGMTATEVMTIQEERQRLMAPHMGRVQHEYLAPKIERRFAMLWRAGQIPPPPPEAEGRGLNITYTSSAALAQRSMEGTAVTRMLADLGPLAQLDPRYMDRVDPDGTFEALHAARGAPASMSRSREEADRLAQARAQAQQQAAQMQQMGEGAGIAQSLAGAAKDAGLALPAGGA